jgi:hypothetical protein
MGKTALRDSNESQSGRNCEEMVTPHNWSVAPNRRTVASNTLVGFGLARWTLQT